MAYTWHKFYGGYNGTGEIANVILIGDPNATGHFGNPLTQAHNSGYGYGIGFENVGQQVKFALNLVGISVNDGANYLGNGGSYVQDSGIYRWFFKVEYSNNGGSSYNPLLSNRVIFNHPWQDVMTYSIQGQPDRYGRINPTSWDQTAKDSQYTNELTIPVGTTHVRFTLTGESAVFPYEIVFPVEQIIPDFRPWAIRRSGEFKSLDTATGKFQIRKNGTFQDVPKMKLSEAGQPNVGTSRIRKNDIFVGQKKVGS